MPKSKGGRDTVSVHPICHRALHRHFSNAELREYGDDLDRLRSDDRLAGFLKWIAHKPPDFYAPTYRPHR